MVKKGTYVQIRAVILKSGERAAGIPDDTVESPLVMWVKGHLTEECAIGGPAVIMTATGRTEQGVLEEAEPVTSLDYGQFVPEIMEIGARVRQLVTA